MYTKGAQLERPINGNFLCEGKQELKQGMSFIKGNIICRYTRMERFTKKMHQTILITHIYCHNQIFYQRALLKMMD